ncbi:HEAT repeat domain-containing protein [Paenibacillus chondroitinus]|uniref:HEAT repeat domain-containing protein n=1 Tax=Paenibacillus chondroitinus TaxID=59842 RepID=A0ABU6DMH9_9BACL|nr:MULTISPECIES: HEAT repeat domain-containing protein [Paenibacillus]MCY9663371.1 HEAT repeat domain-containing protein [Paenibacillus anseongense]MEB4798990.1 HEAT repeat domain-containing protein [Paenibacillus chondroitinus]
MNIELNNEVPANFEELKKSANRSSNWRERQDAVEQLGQWNDQQSINILTRMMTSDAVYPIQELAYRKLKAFGEDVQLPPRKKGDLVKGAGKVFVRIKKSLPEGHTFEAFKEKLQKTRTDVYDTYEGDKGADFDHWLETTWASLLK